MGGNIGTYQIKKRCCLVRNEAGSSLVEVMMAILVFMVIMVGGLQYFFLPQANSARSKTKRLAVSAVRNRMETLTLLDYAQITSDSNETNTPVSLGNITGSRTTTITEVDDPADSLGVNDTDGDSLDYKTITVQISWSVGNNQNVVITTEVNEFGN